MGLKTGPALAAHLLLLPGCLLAVLLAAMLLPALLPVPPVLVGLPVHLPLIVVLSMLLLGLPGGLPLPVGALLPIAVPKALGVALAIPWREALHHELKAESGDMLHESVTDGRRCVQLRTALCSKDRLALTAETWPPWGIFNKTGCCCSLVNSHLNPDLQTASDLTCDWLCYLCR